jgi:hypothetical protein
MSLLLKIVEGSNTAVYLPAESSMRFLLPQVPGSEYHEGQTEEVRFLEVTIPMDPARMTSEEFLFTDKIWDDLEAAQGVVDEALFPVVTVPPGGPPSGGATATNATGATGAAATNASGATGATGGAGDDDDIVYSPVTTLDCPSSAVHQDRVGDTFFDSEDSANFKIVAVCTSTTYGADKLFFKYFNVDQFPAGPPSGGGGGEEEGGGVHQYTPCEELMSADWATWAGEQREWIQCITCDKWRKLPLFPPTGGTKAVRLSDLPEEWTCSMAAWIPGACGWPEESYTDVVSVAEGVNGALVPAMASNDTTNTNTNTTADPQNTSAPVAAAAVTDTDVDADRAVYTVDLQTAVRHIVSALKGNVGNKLLTRLSPETTHGVLNMALQS